MKSQDVTTDERAQLLNEKEAASLLGVSGRHLRRLADSGRAPAPLKLGYSVRWRRVDLERWIAAGCPKCRSVRRISQ